MNDPRIRNVTFTAVEVTRDLRLARVFYSVLDPEQSQDAASRGLQSAKGVIKRALGPRLSLRYMPDLEFIYDPTIQQSQHIEKLLKNIEDPGS